MHENIHSVYAHMCMYVCIYVYIYYYFYRERDKKREQERERERRLLGHGYKQGNVGTEKQRPAVEAAAW